MVDSLDGGNRPSGNRPSGKAPSGSGNGGTDPVAAFRRQLQHLYERIGRPPYRSLEMHADHGGRVLRTSTTSDLLNGPGKPRWTTVESFLSACERFVLARRGGRSPADLRLDQWYARYSDMESALADRAAEGQRHPEQRRPGQRRSGSRKDALRLSGSPATAAPVQVVRSLRADITTFTGRTEQIEAIIRTIESKTPATAVPQAETAGAGGIVVIHAIDGMPGVGKTALAIHVGHQVSEEFPDGQLYVDLFAHSTTHAPADPADVLAGLLAASGMAPGQIPEGLEERSARWRDRMAGRRILLVLDNAASHAQVAPLLPGTAGCMVIVTSRRRMAGLRRDYGATLLPLGLMSETDAMVLFTRVCQQPVAAHEMSVVADLVRWCGYLPLAVTILAAGVEPGVTSLTDLLADVQAAQGRLTSIDTHLDGQELGVAAAFDLSYQRMTSEEQRVFRLLSLSHGVDIDPYAASALNGLPVDTTIQHLHTLHTHRLIEQPCHHRYRLHSLIIAYLRGHATPEEQSQATERMLDYYGYAAAAAVARLPRRGANHPGIVRPAPGSPTPDLTDLAQATRWLRTERPNLIAYFQYAQRHGQHARMVDLATSLAALLRLDGPRQQGIELLTPVLAVVRELGDRSSEGWAVAELGSLQRLVGEHQNASGSLEQALTIFRELGHRNGEAWVLAHLGTLRWFAGSDPKAPDRLEHAMVIFRELADRSGEAYALAQLGVRCRLSCDYQRASSLEVQALTIFRDLGDRDGEAWALWELSGLRRSTGDYAEAILLQDQVLAIRRDLGDRDGEAWALSELGGLWVFTGEYPRAATALEQCLVIFRDLGDRNGETWACWELGMLRRMTNAYQQATALQKQVLIASRASGNRYVEGWALAELGITRIDTCEYSAADDVLAQALAIFRELNDVHSQGWALDHLGTLRRVTGDYEEAGDLLEQAVTIFRSIDASVGESWASAQLGVLHGETGRHASAMHLLGQALTVFEKASDRNGQAWALARLGAVQHLTGDYGQAAASLDEALAIFREIGDRLGESEVLNRLGSLLLRTGSRVQGHEHHSRALALAREIGVPLEECRAIAGIERCAIGSGSVTELD